MSVIERSSLIFYIVCINKIMFFSRDDNIGNLVSRGKILIKLFPLYTKGVLLINPFAFDRIGLAL